MNQKIKISQLPAKGSNLAAADLLEIAEFTGTGYISKSITGQEIIDAIPLPPSGITIGTTAITSGTVGRVLFEGTGNVVQQSSSLFWDATNNRLGVGTETPTKYFELKLPTGVNTLVNGFALTRGSGSGIFVIGNGTSNTTDFIPSIYSKSSVDNLGFYFGASVFSASSTFPAMEFQSANSTNTGAIGSGQVAVRFANWTTQIADFRGNGNVLIGTTTDAGFRLDVNGTARVQGNLTLRNVTDELLFANATVKVRRVSDKLSLEGFAGFDFIDTNTAFTRMQIRSTGNVLIGTTTDAGFRLDVNGTARVSGDVTSTGSFITTSQVGYSNNSRTITFSDAFAGLNYQGFGGHRFKSYNSSTALYVEMITLVGNQSNLRVGINSPTPNASAILDVVSTDKGFLKPRLTTTEKNAIASPAAGLEVYDTTLNRPCFYDGTTWITL